MASAIPFSSPAHIKGRQAVSEEQTFFTYGEDSNRDRTPPSNSSAPREEPSGVKARPCAKNPERQEVSWDALQLQRKCEKPQMAARKWAAKEQTCRLQDVLLQRISVAFCC